MKIAIFLSLSISLFYSCNSKSESKHEIHNVKIKGSKINDSLRFKEIQGGLFFFQPTKDSKYCDLSKIIETDCGIGYFYFNEKNKVTFTFQCVGDTSIVYFLGTYEKSKIGIDCQFKYSYECFFDSSGNSFNRKRNLMKEKELIKMEIYNANCEGVLGFKNGAEKYEEKEFYVLQKANKMQNELFWNFFKTSKVKSEYL